MLSILYFIRCILYLYFRRPCLRRGGAWDHRRCAAWALVPPVLALASNAAVSIGMACPLQFSQVGFRSWAPQMDSIQFQYCCYAARFTHPLKPSKSSSAPQSTAPWSLRTVRGNCFYCVSKLLRGTFSASLKTFKSSKPSAKSFKA